MQNASKKINLDSLFVNIDPASLGQLLMGCQTAAAFEVESNPDSVELLPHRSRFFDSQTAFHTGARI